MKKTILTVVFALITIATSAQYGRRDANRIGFTGGMNQFSLNSNNFGNKAGMGWNAGLSVRGNFYNDFDMVYAMQFSENNFTVATKKLLQTEEVKFTLPSAQITLQLSYKIVENHLSVEIGPTVQIHGKFGIDKDDENNDVTLSNGSSIKAKELTDIGRFDFYPSVGITAGVRHVRANIQYQYCVNNMLAKLNKGDLVYKSFKANPGILSANLIIYL